MPSRTRMTMRAYIQRNTGSANAHGHPDVSFTALSTTPCHAWVDTADTRHTNEKTVSGTRYRGLFPLGTDVTAADQIQKITDRRGTQKFPLMAIDAVIRRKDHLELRMRSQK